MGCSNGYCIAEYCDSVSHVDATGHSWSDVDPDKLFGWESTLYREGKAYLSMSTPSESVEYSHRDGNGEQFGLWLVHHMREREKNGVDQFTPYQISPLLNEWRKLVGLGDRYPYRTRSGGTRWACCDSLIGGPCEHVGVRR